MLVYPAHFLDPFLGASGPKTIEGETRTSVFAANFCTVFFLSSNMMMMMIAFWEKKIIWQAKYNIL